jgi:hypothetical protein
VKKVQTEDAKKTDKSSKPVKSAAPESFAAKPIPLPQSISKDDAEVESDSKSQFSSGGDSASAPSLNSPAVQASLRRAESSPARANGVKRKSTTPSVSSDGGDSNVDEPNEVAGAPEKKRARTSSPDESDDTSESDGDDIHTTPKAPDSTAAKATEAMLQPIATQDYIPPQGFVPLESSQLEQRTSLPANLDGKQIWYITAPSNIPVSTLNSFAKEALSSNRPALSFEDVDYTLSEDALSANDVTTIFLPTSEGYRPTRQKISRKLHLQQRLVLPNLSALQASQLTGSSAAADVAAPAVSSRRPQPKGLRMRYRPPGFGLGKLGTVGSGSDSSEDKTETRTGFQFPRGLGAHGPAKRDIGNNDVDMLDADVGTPVPQSKKKKKREGKSQSETQNTGVNGTIESQDSLPWPPHSQVTSSPEVSAIPPAKLTANGVPLPASTQAMEKAKRKEEKRLKKERKEAKRKAKEASQ